jgi:hypothetical protein
MLGPGDSQHCCNVVLFYREKLEHTNFKWNENGTMTYTTTRNAEFEPELNTLSLNDTFFAPNIALLVSITPATSNSNSKISL